MINQVISQAIRKKRLLKLVYKNRTVTVEPHSYGLNVLGAPSLLCYAVCRDEAERQVSGWKLVNLRELVSVSDTTDSFTSPRQGYRRNDTSISALFEQL